MRTVRVGDVVLVPELIAAARVGFYGGHCVEILPIMSEKWQSIQWVGGFTVGDYEGQERHRAEAQAIVDRIEEAINQETG